MKIIIIAVVLLALFMPVTYAQDGDDDSKGEYLGEYSSNQLDPDSTSNPIGRYGSEISPSSINNPIGQFGSPVSPNSVNNPLATDTPKLYSQDGKYLGKVSSNTLDTDSISNPIGRYGSSISPDSINNPIGRYRSSISPESANNPLATNAPVIVYGRDDE